MVLLVLLFGTWGLIEFTSDRGTPPLSSGSSSDSGTAESNLNDAGNLKSQRSQGAARDNTLAPMRPPVLFGTVRDSRGVVVSGAKLRLLKLQLDEWGGRIVYDEASTLSREDGSYRFDSTLEGDLYVEVSRGDEVPVGRWAKVPRSTAFDLELLPPKDNLWAQSPQEHDVDATAQGSLRVHVVATNSEGERIAASGARVAIVRAGEFRHRERPSNRDGIADFDALAGGRYYVAVEGEQGITRDTLAQVRSSRFTSLTSPHYVDPQGERVEVTVELIQWSQVGGVVTNTAGDALPGASVGFATGSARETLIANEDGRFHCRYRPHATYWLTAGSASFSSVVGQQFPGLAPGESRFDHVVVVSQAYALTLQINDAAGNGVEGVVVESCQPPSMGLSSNMRDYAVGQCGPCRTDAQGRVVLSLADGYWYLLRIAHPAFSPTATYIDLRDAHEVHAETRTIELGPQPKGHIVGRVIDADGEGVSGVAVIAREGEGGPSRTGLPHSYGSYRPLNLRVVVTDANGHFDIAGVGVGERYTLSVRHSGYVALEHGGVVGGATDLELVCSGPMMLSAEVYSEAGNPVPGVRVRVGRTTVTTGADGVFSAILEPRVKYINIQGPKVRSARLLSEDLIESGRTIVKLSPRVHGILLDPDGEPIPHAYCYVECRSATRRYRYGIFEISTDREGFFDVPWQGSNDPGADMQLIVTRHLPHHEYDADLAEGVTFDGLEESEEGIELQFRWRESSERQ